MPSDLGNFSDSAAAGTIYQEPFTSIGLNFLANPIHSALNCNQRRLYGELCVGAFLKYITCIPVADSFWYLAKLIQLCKV